MAVIRYASLLLFLLFANSCRKDPKDCDPLEKYAKFAGSIPKSNISDGKLPNGDNLLSVLPKSVCRTFSDGKVYQYPVEINEIRRFKDNFYVIATPIGITDTNIVYIVNSENMVRRYVF